MKVRTVGYKTKAVVWKVFWLLSSMERVVSWLACFLFVKHHETPLTIEQRLQFYTTILSFCIPQCAGLFDTHSSSIDIWDVNHAIWKIHCRKTNPLKSCWNTLPSASWMWISPANDWVKTRYSSDKILSKIILFFSAGPWDEAQVQADERCRVGSEWLVVISWSPLGLFRKGA